MAVSVGQVEVGNNFSSVVEKETKDAALVQIASRIRNLEQLIRLTGIFEPDARKDEVNAYRREISTLQTLQNQLIRQK